MTEQEEQFELVGEALVARQEWEKGLQKFESQRFAHDRSMVNDDPWTNASNYREKLADFLIETKKAFYSQIIFASENLANFKALTPANYSYCDQIAPYFDQVIKECTRWESENVFTLDSGLQDGEGFMRIGYDMDKQVPVFKWTENLMIIQPADATYFEDNEWYVEVIHLSKAAAKRRFGKLPGFENLMKLADREDGANDENDQVARLLERYNRRGINLSGNTGKMVFWQLTRTDDKGRKRLKTLSPDDPKFDFQDDRKYPYFEPDGSSSLMHEQFRREWTTPNQHSSRGIPELIEDEEFLATALRRFKHNIMSLVLNPVFTTPSGQPPGSTNNFSMLPGSFLPGGAEPVQWGQPPVSIDDELNQVKSNAERRMGSYDQTLGNAANRQDSRTAREIGFVQSIQQLSVNYETTPWKKFCRGCYRKAWHRMVQFKPKSLTFFINNSIQSLPPDALNGDYMIDVSWSGDNINKEYNGQKAQALFNESLKLQVPQVIEQTWKNLVEHFAPGKAQRFEINSGIEQADMIERIGNEIDTMVSIGFPVRPKQDIDHYAAVLRTMQFIQAQQIKGKEIDPKSMNLLSQYMAAHRDMLAKTNPQKRKLLDNQLNELEMHMQQPQTPQGQQMPVDQSQAQPPSNVIPVR